MYYIILPKVISLSNDKSFFSNRKVPVELIENGKKNKEEGL